MMTTSATLHVMNMSLHIHNMQSSRSSQVIRFTKPDHITSYAALFDQLEIPHKFFQNWIVFRMLGIRDCVPLRSTTRQARRRGLQNKSILNEKQRELIICSPKNILNTVLVL